MKKLLTIFVLLYCSIARADAIIDGAKAIPWNVSHLSSLQGVLSNLNNVNYFVSGVTPPDIDGQPVLAMQVNQYKFVDLHHDSNIELIVTFGDIGRGQYKNMYVISQQGNGFAFKQLSCDSLIDLTKAVTALQQNTNPATLPRELQSTLGAVNCMYD